MEKKEDKPTEDQKTFKGKVNAYGFIRLNKGVRERWGITKGTEQAVSIELTSENALIIRKNYLCSV